MITAPLPRASSSGTGQLSMIIPRYYGLTITYYTGQRGIRRDISQVATVLSRAEGEWKYKVRVIFHNDQV